MISNLRRSVSFKFNVEAFVSEAFLIARLFTFDNLLPCSLIHGRDITFVALFLFNGNLLDCHVLEAFLFFLHMPLMNQMYLVLDLSLVSVPRIQ